jgi:hypothetical protein
MESGDGEERGKTRQNDVAGSFPSSKKMAEQHIDATIR